MSSKPEYTFRVHGIKKNGQERRKTFKKINEALRFMWRIKEAKEIRLDVILKDNALGLFIKLGRRRGINTRYALIPEGRPTLSKAGTSWIQLPTKFNDIE